MDHSQTPITLRLGGIDYAFGRIVPKDIFELVQWANDNERKAALEAIPCNTVEERVAVFRQAGNRYSFENISEILTDAAALFHLLYVAFRKWNPEIDEEAFGSLLGHSDMSLMETWVDLLAGIVRPPEDVSGNGRKQTRKRAGTSSAGTPSSASSAEPTPA